MNEEQDDLPPDWQALSEELREMKLRYERGRREDKKLLDDSHRALDESMKLLDKIAELPQIKTDTDDE